MGASSRRRHTIRQHLNTDLIKVFEARQHNLKGFDLFLPLYKVIAVTGLSGSGKSSLALDTLYAEGQRRYVETFSAYARQFLERMPRPQVDHIENIPAAIAIEQSNPVKSSRSTLGTLTELNHFLKMIFFRESSSSCPRCGRPVKSSSAREAAREILAEGKGLLAVITTGVRVKEDFSYLRQGLLEQGYFRSWSDEGMEDISLMEPRSEIQVVVDRVEIKEKNASRLIDSLEKAFTLGEDGIDVHLPKKGTLKFTGRYACPYCRFSFGRPTPNLFSFNSPVGACPECRGFGRVIDVDWDLAIPNQALSLYHGAVKVFEVPAARDEKEELLRFCQKEGISLQTPWRDLPQTAKDRVLFGNGAWPGVKGFFNWLETKRYKAHVRIFLSRFRAYLPCPSCGGTRFKKEALSYRIDGFNIAQVNALSLLESRSFFEKMQSGGLDPATLLLYDEINRRLSYLCEAGLGYLSLDRQSRTLSGGEVARAMLTRALSSSLIETLYILDEPSRGLHARDSARIVDLLKRLSSRKNTVCVVEHDPEIVRSADFSVELGPGAGENGGRLLYAGETKGLLGRSTPTARVLAGLDRPKKREDLPSPIPYDDFLKVTKAKENNLKGIDLLIPKGAMTVISGVSGSGKSTLLERILFQGAKREKGLATERPGRYERMEGLENIEAVVLVDQSPIGRSARSTPASYLKIYDEIRQILAKTPEARRRGLGPSAFSFNVPGGRCEVCEGQGFEKVEMQFLSDLFLPCPACRGRRFRTEMLEVYYGGRNIADILEMTISEAVSFFAEESKLARRLEGPMDVGLGYLRLGQPVHTLSGGEAQRLKVAHHLFTQPQERALILIDEPTVGLHMKDIETLGRALKKLTGNGNTVVIVEHNFEILGRADWVIDLGPEGGEKGGEILYQGPLSHLLHAQDSVTARWFEAYLDGRRRKHPPLQREREESPPEGIRVLGARHHNLKNLSLEIPRNRFVVVTGLSGSGKSTLAFDILFAEGQRRYVESLPTYVRQFIKMYERPEVDLVLGLPPTVALEQRTSRAGPRSTVATLTEIYHYLRLLYAKAGEPHCPSCRRTLSTWSLEEMAGHVIQEFNGQRVHILAPKARRRKGFHRPLFETALKKARAAARVDGKLLTIPPIPELSRYKEHTVEISVGDLEIAPHRAPRVRELIQEAFQEGNSEAVILGSDREVFLSQKYYCPDCRLGLPSPDPLLFSFNTTAGACPRCEGLGTLGKKICTRCGGTRLVKEALAYLVEGKNIGQISGLTVLEGLKFLDALKLSGSREVVARPILTECLARLTFLKDLGLGYLTLDRSGETLSGGEAQRIRLSSELGSNLTGVCYILDEPTIGLHPRDNALLIKALQSICMRGNSVLVVEHDEETLLAADWVIDLGPGGGDRGGKVVFQGEPQELESAQESATALMLREEGRYAFTSRERGTHCLQWLSIEGASARNLRNLDFKIPLGALSCITGVSGSGKSTLLMDVLYANVHRGLRDPGRFTGCVRIRGMDPVKRILVVDHSPIGRTPRSTPATYIGFMTEIRTLLSGLPNARERGWKPGRFSFNLTDGRCKECRGQGTLKVEMKFLPEVYVPCESCGGRRYNEETLSVTYKGKNIAEILDMTFFKAKTFFSAVPSLRKSAEVICDLGLDYLSLGQASPTLSGGEAQRIKLAREFVKSSSGGTLYLLDEPTTGLHAADIQRLIRLFHRFMERGDTVVLIEHNLEVVKEADWVVDLGPEGGKGGGELLFQGPPRDLTRCRASHTGKFLKKFLCRSRKNSDPERGERRGHG